jgi:hypothetical protein
MPADDRNVILNSADHWRKRAEEMRTLAEAVGDPVAKRLILSTADDYERLAKRAEERANEAARAILNVSNDE